MDDEEEELAALRNSEAFRKYEAATGAHRKQSHDSGSSGPHYDSHGSIPPSINNNNSNNNIMDSITSANPNPTSNLYTENGELSDDDYGPPPPPELLNPLLANQSNLKKRDRQDSEYEDYLPTSKSSKLSEEDLPVQFASSSSFKPHSATTVDNQEFKVNQFDIYRKRKIEKSTASKQMDVQKNQDFLPTKKADAFYVYGKDEIPSSSSSSSKGTGEVEPKNDKLAKFRETISMGEIDLDIISTAFDLKLPMTHEVIVKANESRKSTTCLALDPSENRMLSASADYKLKFWDFSTMDKTFQSFRTLEEVMGQSITHTLQWSGNGEKFLLAFNAPQAKVMDREGRLIVETAKGYPFSADMTHTTGHVGSISKACWISGFHSFLTCSHDSTVRFWDLESMKKHKNLIKLKNERGATGCKAWNMTVQSSSEPKTQIAVACDDNSIQLYPSNGPFFKASHRISNAFGIGNEVTSMEFHPSRSQLLAVRSADDALKIWDLRNLKTPLGNFPNLYNRHFQTGMAWSPQASAGEFGQLVTAVSSSNKGDPGQLAFINLDTLSLNTIDVSTSSAVNVLWPSGMNQIICGMGDGSIKVFFDPETSSNGIMTGISKAIRRTHTHTTTEFDIIAPLAPRDLTDKQRRKQALKDPVLSHIPAKPVSGVYGSHGLLASNMKADMMKKIMPMDAKVVHEDPREALLRHADKKPITTIFGSSPANPLDYEALERMNEAEQKRAEVIEKLQRQKERK